MKNLKSACIFEHEGMDYVCDFDKMTCWIVTADDTEDPVTTLDLRRSYPMAWAYKYQCDEDENFQVDPDATLIEKLEKNYEQYLNQIILEHHDQPAAQDFPKAPTT